RLKSGCPTGAPGLLDGGNVATGRSLSGRLRCPYSLPTSRGRPTLTNVPDRCCLLHAPYPAPALRVGARATRLFRDCDVVITSWTDAPIPWPRGVLVGGTGHPSPIVNEELARAIINEAACAVQFWWSVSVGVVWHWRKAFGVNKTNNAGTNRLVRIASEMGADATRDMPLPAHVCEARRKRALEQNIGARLRKGYHG